MIETELLTFPLEGKDKFIAKMKTFNGKAYRIVWSKAEHNSGKAIGYVSGLQSYFLDMVTFFKFFIGG